LDYNIIWKEEKPRNFWRRASRGDAKVRRTQRGRRGKEFLEKSLTQRRRGAKNAKGKREKNFLEKSLTRRRKGAENAKGERKGEMKIMGLETSFILCFFYKNDILVLRGRNILIPFFLLSVLAP